MNKLAVLLVFAASILSGKAFVTDTLTVDATGFLPEAMKVTVITPDTDDESAGEVFPTVYLLNGYSGDNGSWGNIRPDLGEFADEYGIVMVMPSGMDSWYWDAPANPNVRMESFITEVLVPHIDANYPTDQRAQNRAITGLSMGGHGALWLGLRHPDIWKNIGSTSGGVNILPFPERWKIKDALGSYESNPEVWETHTVINLVPELRPGVNNIIFDCGSEDFFAEVNDQLHRALLKAKIPHDYISRPGTHNAAYWANALPYQLMFFDTKFDRSSPN